MGYAKSLLEVDEFTCNSCYEELNDIGECPNCGSDCCDDDYLFQRDLKVDLGNGKNITDQKLSRIAENLSFDDTIKFFKSKGWNAYRTVNVIIGNINDPKSVTHLLNPAFASELNHLDEKVKLKLQKILSNTIGLTDVIAFKDGMVHFVEIKGVYTFKDLKENQKIKREQIEKAGFRYSIHRRKYDIVIKFIKEEIEGDQIE